LVFEAVFTEPAIAVIAALQATRAYRFATVFTFDDASGAEVSAATATNTCTFSADVVAATLTDAPVVFADQGAAVVTASAIPVAQGNIRAGSVVRSQQVGNEQEKVRDTALGKRTVDCHLSVSLAYLFVIDVGMSDIVVTTGRVRIERLHSVAVIVRHPLDFQLDLEWSKVDSFKGD